MFKFLFQGYIIIGGRFNVHVSTLESTSKMETNVQDKTGVLDSDCQECRQLISILPHMDANYITMQTTVMFKSVSTLFCSPNKV